MNAVCDEKRIERCPTDALAVGCAVQALMLASALWFDRVISWSSNFPYAGDIEQVYAALVTTWADGSYDTTMGYRYFGYRVLVFAFLFALAGFGLWRRRAWSYELTTLLACIGLFEPALRLAAISSFMPYSDSLGYQLDVRQAGIALVAASLPSAAVLAILMLPKTRRVFGKRSINWRQFTLSNIATATTVCAVLLSHARSLSQIYGGP